MRRDGFQYSYVRLVLPTPTPPGATPLDVDIEVNQCAGIELVGAPGVR